MPTHCKVISANKPYSMPDPHEKQTATQTDSCA